MKPDQFNKTQQQIRSARSGKGSEVLVEGLHAIKHAFRFNAEQVLLICCSKEELNNLVEQLCPDLKKYFAQAEEVGDKFDQLTESEIRTGILGIFLKPTLATMEESGVHLLLDDPRDLDNIGAVVRVIAAAGVHSLIITGDSNPWNFRAIRAGAGLQFAIPIYNLSINEIIKINLPIICFDERGQELDSKLKADLPKGAIYVFGSERAGISPELKVLSNKIVRLPMQEGVSSLNLATSVAAALYSLK
jgi:TrmH family RNA methyltransferase